MPKRPIYELTSCNISSAVKLSENLTLFCFAFNHLALNNLQLKKRMAGPIASEWLTVYLPVASFSGEDVKQNT